MEAIDATKSIISSMATSIRKYYVDDKIAERIASRFDNIESTPAWNRYKETTNPLPLIIYLNAIIRVESDDGHFVIKLPNSGEPAVLKTLTRATPHYISFDGFEKSELTRSRVIDAFANAKDPLIIDLRNCSGGDPEMAYFILSFLFKDGEPLFKLKRRDGETLFRAASVFPYYSTHNKTTHYSGRVRVLVNQATASAAENVAFIIKNKKRGEIYGTKTCGVANASFPINFPPITLNLPYAKTVDPITGKDWEGVGVSPDHRIVSKEYIDLIYN